MTDILCYNSLICKPFICANHLFPNYGVVYLLRARVRPAENGAHHDFARAMPKGQW